MCIGQKPFLWAQCNRYFDLQSMRRQHKPKLVSWYNIRAVVQSPIRKATYTFHS